MLVFHGIETSFLAPSQFVQEELSFPPQLLYFFKQLSLCIQFFLVNTIGSICFFLKESELFLRVWHSNKRSSFLNNDKPSPVSKSHEFSKLSLANLDEFSLISTLEEFFTSDLQESLTLQVSKQTNNNVITLLFKEGKSTSSEEDKSVTKTISFSSKFNFVHKGIHSCFVIS